jgi:nocturnin
MPTGKWVFIAAGVAGVVTAIFRARVQKGAVAVADGNGVDKVVRLPEGIDEHARDKLFLDRKVAELRAQFGPLLPRSFPKPRRASSGRGSVRFLQFNTLAEGLSSLPDYGGFIKTPRESLDFHGFRKFRLLDEMLRFEPDIIACEEMDHFDDFFRPAMKHYGYEGVFFPKLNATTLRFGPQFFSDGCAFFWRTSAVSLLEHKTMRYKSVPGPGLWSQVALIGRFEILGTSSTNGPNVFLAACTHLKAKTGVANEFKRTESLKQLLLFMAQMKQDPRENVVVLGDFNTDEAGLDYLTTYKTMSEHPLGLKSAMKAASTNQEEPQYTTCKIRQEGHENCHTIDYIWVPNSSKVVSMLEIPNREALPPCRLPCVEYPSDHLSIGCDVVFM